MLPKRIFRLAKHLAKGLRYFAPTQTPWKQQWKHLKPWIVFSHWSLDLFFYIIDIIGIGEIYETILDLFKFNSRPLNREEIALAKTVFGDAINYHRVLIDEYAIAGPKQARFAYVSFYTINSWGPMRRELLMHELTHIWHYEQLGSVYIPRALRAQQPQYGYNYGGLKSLTKVMHRDGNIHAFNLEQQGDIVFDYFRLMNGVPPRWGVANEADIGVYEYFIKDIRKDRNPSEEREST